MSDVLIVGGGISGLLAARELSLAGASVTVVERGEVGRESSWAGGGILSPLYPWRYPEAVSELAAWSLSHYSQIAENLFEQSGIDPECLISGMLIPGAASETEEAERWSQRYGVEVQAVDDGMMLRLEPGLAVSGNGLWMPTVGQVRNPRMLQALYRALLGLGVKFELHCQVDGVLIEKDQAQGVMTDKGNIHADCVVVTGGSWSGEILGDLAARLKIEPVRGQMLLFQAKPGVVQRIVLSDGYYVIPRRDGHVLVGSSMERVGFDKSVTEEMAVELKQVAARIVPELVEYPVVKQWAGLRPGTENGIPYICRHPEVERLFISAGHFRNGVAMGPASARLLSDIVQGVAPILDPAPYQLDAQK